MQSQALMESLLEGGAAADGGREVGTEIYFLYFTAGDAEMQ